MRGKSHRHLGRYLVRQYMPNTPKRYIRAFLLGCVEPDKNPATYLKGSFRSQWLRGHNYGNAQRYMRRISGRLEEKSRWNLLDYYKMGKLIHYTTDAFTYAHNESFGTKLSDHRAYEQELQDHFLDYLENPPLVELPEPSSVMDSIQAYHQDYERHPVGIRTDSHFALTACCCVLSFLVAN